MAASPTVLVPLRSPGLGKTRLSGVLTPPQRAQLAGAMLADVAAALARAPVAEVVVVASGPTAAAAASALGLEVVLDPPGTSGLDAALRAAAARIGQVDELLVIAADLPQLRPDDVGAVLAADAAVVVAPTVDGGTGALLRRPGEVIGTAYGPGSARRHQELAHDAGLTLAVIDRPGCAHDVDTARDLSTLAAAPVGAATRRVLISLSDEGVRAG